MIKLKPVLIHTYYSPSRKLYKSLLLGCFLGLSLVNSWGQSELDRLFAKAEDQRLQARIPDALKVLQTARPLAEEARRLPEWQINTAKCLSDADSISAALELLQVARAQLIRPDQDLLLAEALNLQGSIALQQNQWEAAENDYREALGIRETYLGFYHEKVADSHNNLGAVSYLLQDYEQALLHHQQALTIRLDILESPHPDLGSTYNNLAACYYDLGEIETALEYNQMALEQRRGSFDEQHPGVADSYNNLGNCYFDLYLLDQAIAAHQKALAIRSALSLPAAQASSHNNLGNCWLESGDFESAVQAFSKAAEGYEQAYGPNHPAIAEVAINQGNAYQEIGDFSNALRRFQLARLILEDQFGPGRPNRIPALLGQANALWKLDKDTSAIPILQLAIRQIQMQLGADHPLLPDAYNNLGNAFFRQQDYSQARANYQLALKGFRAKPGKTRQWASALFNIGNTFQAQQQFSSAQNYYQQALDLLSDPYTFSDLYYKLQAARASAFAKTGRLDRARSILEAQIRQIEQEDVIPQTTWLDIYVQLADLYRQEGRLDNLREALQLYQEAINQLDHLLTFNRSRQSKRDIRLAYFFLYENAIQIALKLADHFPEENYPAIAFSLSEKSKALLIREASNQSEAQHFLELPDSLVKKERELKQQIAEYGQLLYEQADQLDSLTLRTTNLAILRLRETYNALTVQLERDYPDYFQMKYRNTPTPTAEIYDQLAEDQAIVSYLVGDSTLFAFVIYQKAIKVFHLERNDLERKTIQLWDAISNFTQAQAAEDYQIYAQQYANNAYQLYQQLIAPIKAKVSLPEGLTIIPDGVLCYLPFDLLVSQPIDSTVLYRFDRYPYLIQDYRFSYAFSVDQWYKMQARKDGDSKVRWASFAPAFYQEKSSFEPLYFNEEEVKNIGRMLPGDRIYVGTAANIRALTQQSSKSSILHLATHGLANARASDFAFLAFTAKDSTDQLLYTQNLYAMDMHRVALVVLSACETGLGEAIPGEGVMSLAHAFRYAGAKSIITTLWSIDDKKTASIMQAFYQELKKGKKKDEALRQARLQYLDQHNGEYAHPFFWGAFIPMGDMQVITFKKDSIYLITKISVVTIIVIILLWLHFHYKDTNGPPTFS